MERSGNLRPLTTDVNDQRLYPVDAIFYHGSKSRGLLFGIGIIIKRSPTYTRG